MTSGRPGTDLPDPTARMLLGHGTEEVPMTVRMLVSLLALGALLLATGCPSPSHDDDDSSFAADDDDTATACEQTYDGHSLCAHAFGSMYFCGDDGECIEASGCLAEDCCVPGESGDEWCAATFGEGSVCAIVNDDGQCT